MSFKNFMIFYLVAVNFMVFLEKQSCFKKRMIIFIMILKFHQNLTPNDDDILANVNFRLEKFFTKWYNESV